MATSFPYMSVPEMEEERPLGYSNMLGGGQPAPQPPPQEQQGFAAMQNPIPPEVQQMNKPTKDPGEIQKRIGGWMQVVQQLTSDPNLMRAVGMFGGALVQPRPMGQSNMGHLAQALMVGQTAHGFGLDAQRQREKEEREEKRVAERHGVDIEGKRASTAQTQASTAETRLNTDLKTRTINSAVKKIQLEVQKAELELGRAKTQAEFEATKTRYETKKLEILASIPDAEVRNAAIADLQSKGVENRLRRSQAGLADAQAGLTGERRTQEQLETKDLQSMTPEERIAFRSRTGKYGATGSAQVAAAQEFVGMWKRANPRKEGETDQAYEQRASQAGTEYMTRAREKPDFENFLKWAAVYGSMNNFEADWKRYQEFVNRSGMPGTDPRSGAGKKGITPEEYNKLPKGARYTHPDGSTRIKQ